LGGNEVGTLKQEIAKIQKMFGRGQDQKPSRTFWEAPEEVMDERFKTHLQSLRDEFREMLQTRDTESQETQSWKQETSEAAKFIRETKGLTEDDFYEISALVKEHPMMEKLRPMERAEYALYLYNRDKGVTDKTPLKNKASTVVGAPNQAGGARTWTEAEMEAEYKKLGDVKDWTPEIEQKAKALETEFKSAYREKRVKRT
jgi:hypothetical protein